MSQLTVHGARLADRRDWDAFVAARPEGDPLQLWAWGDTLEVRGEMPVRLVARGDDSTVRGVAGLLVRRTSLGQAVGYVPHGPLWDREAPDADAVLDALLAGLRAAGTAERAVVVKVDPRSLTGDDAACLAGLLRSRGLRTATHDLQAATTRIVSLLDGADQLRATWDASARNLVRRAAREGVTVTVHRDADAASIGAFWDLLRATSDRAGFRIAPREHFVRLAAGTAPTGGWYLALASHGDRVIAGDLMLRVGDRSFFLYGGSLRGPGVRNLNGAYAVMDGVMHALAVDGVRTLDLWGVAETDDPGADPAWVGFSHFKRLFDGTRLRHPGTFDLVVNRPWDAVRRGREQLRDVRGSVRRDALRALGRSRGTVR